jgi:photosystem II stability/assembly factor-like uncharacterized protein
MRAMTVASVILLSVAGGWAMEGEWVSLAQGIPVSRSPTTIAVDPGNPEVLYAGGPMNGLYKTADGGLTWIPLWKPVTDRGAVDRGIVDIAVDPHRSSVVYVGVITNGFTNITGGVFKSTDGGLTWKTMNAGLPDSSVIRLVADPLVSDVLYATPYSGGLFKSVDGGTNWQEMPSEGGFLAIAPRNSQVLYLANYNRPLRRSTDGGMNWMESSGGIPADTFVRIVEIDPRNQDVVYAGGTTHGGDIPQGVVFKSTDAGASWTQVFELEDGGIQTLAIDPAHPEILYAGSAGKVHNAGTFRSVDGGKHWTRVHPFGPSSLAINPQHPGILYAAMMNGGHGVYRATFLFSPTAVEQATWGRIKQAK